MSDPINNGGSAFPEPFVPKSSGLSINMHPGMSLRDWFAGQALAGLTNGARGTGWRKSELAKNAFEFADAMLAARGAK
jgi:hypothetical protein